MTAVVVPFPFAKRRAYIRRQIDNVKRYRPRAAERYLASRIDDQVRRLRRFGIIEDRIQADIAPVEKIFADGLQYLFGPTTRRKA
jgi:hypothetical protein